MTDLDEERLKELAEKMIETIDHEGFTFDWRYGSTIFDRNKVEAICLSYLQQAQPQWISVETVPQRGHFYLVLLCDLVITMAWFGVAGWESASRFEELRGITHYQPLPAPPESKGALP